MDLAHSLELDYLLLDLITQLIQKLKKQMMMLYLETKERYWELYMLVLVL